MTTLNMEVINKPKVYYTRKSLSFILKDKRKIISALIIISLPVVNNLWRLVPETIDHSYYGTMQVFLWNICIHSMLTMVSLAWYFTIPKKDTVLQIISYGAIAFGIFLTIEVFPFATETPLWFDIVASVIIFYFIYLAINYIKSNYLSKPSDYKVLHDGLVYDIHHQRFLGSINRIAGLLEIAEMEEPYKHLCEQEIEEIKESIAYIAEKYEELK